MRTRYKAAFALYLISALVLAGFALRYLFAGELTSYHQKTVGLPWADLAPNHQLVFLTLYRVLGVHMLATALALGFMLAIPYRRGEPWARHAVTAVALCSAAPSLYLTVALQMQSGVPTPWPGPAVATVMLVAAWLLAAPRPSAADHGPARTAPGSG